MPYSAPGTLRSLSYHRACACRCPLPCLPLHSVFLSFHSVYANVHHHRVRTCVWTWGQRLLGAAKDGEAFCCRTVWFNYQAHRVAPVTKLVVLLPTCIGCTCLYARPAPASAFPVLLQRCSAGPTGRNRICGAWASSCTSCLLVSGQVGLCGRMQMERMR